MKFSLGGMLKAFIKKKWALTVGELVVSTVAVGVIAILTLGGVNSIIQDKQMETQETMLNNELSVALATLQAQGKLEKVTSTSELIELLKQNFDVAQVLTKDQVKDNFADSYAVNYKDPEGKEKVKNIRPERFDAWIVTSKGVRLAITFNQDYTPAAQFAYDESTYNEGNFLSLKARNNALNAVYAVYDTNGKASPNKYLKDFGIVPGGDDELPLPQPCDCTLNPDMPECQPSYCQQHPDALECICKENPDSLECCYLEENKNKPECYCINNPNDLPNCCNLPENKNKCECIDCTKPENKDNACCDPGDNPEDYICGSAEKDKYCKANPNDLPYCCCLPQNKDKEKCKNPPPCVGCDCIDCEDPKNLHHHCCGDTELPEPCCTLTEDICAQQHGQVLVHPDSPDCFCECQKPQRQGNLELDTDPSSPTYCEYKCNFDFTKFDPCYADIDKSKEACACVPKEADALDKCTKYGGHWDNTTCSCKCDNGEFCKKQDSCGYSAPVSCANNTPYYCQCGCSKSLYDANVGKYSQEGYGDLTVYTNKPAPVVGDACFSCLSVADYNAQHPNHKIGDRAQINKNQCGCSVGCKQDVVPNPKDKYAPYFKWHDIDEADQKLQCSHSCNVDALKELVNELNKAHADDQLRPFVMDKYKKSNLLYSQKDHRMKIPVYQDTSQKYTIEDFKNGNFTSVNMDQAKRWYFVAAAIGGTTGNNNSAFLNEYKCNGKAGPNRKECKEIYNKLFNGANSTDYGTDKVGRFYKFLIYFNDIEFDSKYGGNKDNYFNDYRSEIKKYLPDGFEYSLGTDKMNELFKLRYKADTTLCAVDLVDFNYGSAPDYDISFHGANFGASGHNAATHHFGFEYIVNKDRFKVPNPNTEKIAGIDSDYPTNLDSIRPKDFPQTKYTNSYWEGKKVGLFIIHKLTYDPIALNMAVINGEYPCSGNTFSAKQACFPQFDLNSYVPATLHWDKDKYVEVIVHWLKNTDKSNYKFLVRQEYKNDKTVNYMFSDVHVKHLENKFGKDAIFDTGFQHLRAEMDTNGDTLINSADREFVKLGLISKADGRDFEPLTKSVFEINTTYGAVFGTTGGSNQNKAAIVENNSQFRRLVQADINKCATNTCLVFDGILTVQGGSPKERWSDYHNRDIKYILYPLGKGNTNHKYQFQWFDASETVTQNFGNAILIHVIDNVPYREFIADSFDIIFKPAEDTGKR